MQQYKCSQRVRITRVGHQRAQLTGQPHPFIAQLVADRGRSGGRPVPLGEHRVDAPEHVRCALRQQLGRGHPQRDVRVPNLALGPGDSLSHCGFGLQQRPGDLGHGEPGDQAQRQRQLRRPVQCGVGTGEHHPQLVVADRMRNARAVGAGADVVDHGGQFLSRTDRLAAQSVQRAVARDRDDPSAWVVRHAVARPGPQRLGEGLLDSVLCDGEVARPPRERGDSRPPFAPKDAVQVGHSVSETGDAGQPSQLHRRRRDHRGHLDRLVAVGGVDVVEPVGDLGAFGVGPVGQQHLAVAHPHRRRR